MTPRIAKPSAEHLQPMIDSFEISLRGAKKKPKTIEIYLDATARFAGHLLTQRPKAQWDDPVKRRDIELFVGWMTEQEYSASYINQQYRSVQQFFKWLCDEEELPNPFAKMTPPKPDEKIVPVLRPEDMAKLIKEAEKRPERRKTDGKRDVGQEFRNRRDAAILRLFASSGARLAEVATLRVDNVSLANREALVTGKGSKQRTVKFDAKAAGAIDRYMRIRASNSYHERPELWLGLMGPMQTKSIYRMITRRGVDVGLKIHPHMFRHTFSHNWLDKGGAEGDLMELNGWESPQMLRRYGASARSARALRSYDRIDVMDGI